MCHTVPPSHRPYKIISQCCYFMLFPSSTAGTGFTIRGWTLSSSAELKATGSVEAGEAMRSRNSSAASHFLARSPQLKLRQLAGCISDAELLVASASGNFKNSWQRCSYFPGRKQLLVLGCSWCLCLCVFFPAWTAGRNLNTLPPSFRLRSGTSSPQEARRHRRNPRARGKSAIRCWARWGAKRPNQCPLPSL